MSPIHQAKADLERIYRTFEEPLRPIGQLYVAGGAVRDALLGREPKDYDLFLLVDEVQIAKHVEMVCPVKQGEPKTVWEALVREVSRMLRQAGLPRSMVRAVIDYGGIIQEIEFILEDGGMSMGSRRTAKVQLVVSTASSIYALLEEFDWNICQFAYGWLPANDEVGYYSCMEWPGDIKAAALRLNADTFPFRTLRRGYRFADRYGLEMNSDDVRHLCKLIAQGTGKEEDEGETFTKLIHKDLEDEVNTPKEP